METLADVFAMKMVYFFMLDDCFDTADTLCKDRTF